METPAGEVGSLLHAWANGDRSVESRLFEIMLPDLHKLAEQLMRREAPDHSLQPTALLNETYCRLVGAHEGDWEDRRYFFAVAARAMRRLLIDHARGHAKVQQVPITGLEAWLRGCDDKLDLAVAVDQLLNELEATHQDWCSIVELKFFMGFTDEEAADALGLPLRTMQRKFGDARRWLYERLESRP